MPSAGAGLVIGVGQCAYDILGALDAYPHNDQKVELNDVTLQGGGPVATALVTLQRLGIATAIASRIGGDGFGSAIRCGLEAEGVDCRFLSVDPGGSSQLAFIAVDREGRRTIFWHRGTAQPLTADEIDPALIRTANALHLDGLHIDAAIAAAIIARDAGVPTLLDGGTVRERTKELLPLIDHMVVSERFARQLCGEQPMPMILEQLLGYGAVAATVTCGERGSWSCERGGEVFHQPAFAVEVVDTTGCGDVFHGGYLYGLLQGMPLPEMVRFAAACAALKARAPGGRAGIAQLSEIVNLIANM